MSMDVTFENEQGFTTGSTDAGVKMTDVPKPAPPAPAAPKSGEPAPSSPGKPFDTPWPTTPEDAQKMIDRLMASPKFKADYANQNNPDRPKLVENLTQLFKLANPQPGEEGEPINPADALPDLRAYAGVPVPEGVTYDPGGEYNFLTYVVNENIPTETARAMSEFYAERVVTAGLRPLSKEDEDDFRIQFAGRLRPEQIDRLIKWHREEIAPRLLKAQQGGR